LPLAVNSLPLYVTRLAQSCSHFGKALPWALRLLAFLGFCGGAATIFSGDAARFFSKI